MRELFEKVTHAPYNERYHIVMADVSIFERMLKVTFVSCCVIDVDFQVMYDPSGVGRELLNRVAPVLGLWHPVKQLCY